MSRWATCWSGAAATTRRWRISHRAVELDTNYAQGHALLGMALMYSGRAAEALDALATSMRLDPHYPNIVLHLMAQAHFSLGH